MEEQREDLQASPEEASEESVEAESESNSREPKEEREMHKATCSDCGVECEVPFKPEEGKPVRCQDCFRKSRPKRNFGRNFERRFYDAKCSECGVDCQVPFKPKEGSSVKCKECFIKSKESQ